jgi:predicted phage terminase large subunit-like protein
MADDLEEISIRPQPGPQEAFLSSEADIAIYGGAAYAGKTFAILLEGSRNVHLPRFSAVCFRRDTTQITNPGGLWDESMLIYPLFGARPVKGDLIHYFPNLDEPSKPGAVIKFAHLEHEKSVYSWDGAQIPLIMFDQLEHFTRTQFFYMLSRNRDPSGTVRPYVRATCNPNADSWLAEFLEWWIDQETGFPIQERAGVIRYMIRDGDAVNWYDSRREIEKDRGKKDAEQAKSVTFVPGTIYDNKIGMANDPSYEGTLKALNRVERERLLGGNWKIRPHAGLLFQREWCATIKALPADCDFVRGWDLAATKKTEANDPDWTVGILLARIRSTGRYVFCHAARIRESPGNVKKMIRNCAEGDGKNVRIFLKQDPGQAGKAQFSDLVTFLDGFMVIGNTVTGDKVTNFGPVSAQCEAGNVDILEGFSKEALLCLEGFPDAAHDDDVDATSAAYEGFHLKGMGLYDFMRQKNDEREDKKKGKPGNGKASAPMPDVGGHAIMEALKR